MIGITFALPTESSGLRKRLREKRNNHDLISGKIGDHSVAICHTGVGAKNCNQRLEQLLHTARPRLVISTGFAGAVVNELKVGDLILAENFSDPGLFGQAQEILSDSKPRSIKLFTSSSIVDSTVERNEIARASGAAAVDMETGSISEICKAHGVPLLSLRVISDTPSEPLPAPAEILFDIDRQRTDLRKLFGHFIVQPSALIRFIGFIQRIQEVRGKLTDALVTLICGL